MRKIIRTLAALGILFSSIVWPGRPVKAKSTEPLLSKDDKKTYLLTLKHAREIFGINKEGEIKTAWHYSHRSHRSHYSHYSHRSHYSHYSYYHSSHYSHYSHYSGW